MSKNWFSAAELAGSPGMPKTERAVLLRATKQSWEQRPKLKGKGVEFNINSLPQETVEFLNSGKELTGDVAPVYQQFVSQIDAEENARTKRKQRESERLLRELSSLSEEKQNLAQAKLCLLQVMDKFVAPFAKKRQGTTGENQFCEQYNKGLIAVDAWIKTLIPSVSPVTLRRWKSTAAKDGVAALAGKYKSAVTSKFDKHTELTQFVLAVVTAKPHFADKPKEVHNLISVKKAESFPHWPTVSVSSVARHLKKVKEQLVTELAYATNPREFNNSHRPLFGTMYPWVSGPNQVWELDSTPTDVQLNVNGKARRYSIIGAIDVFTRRLMLTLMPTSNSEGICLLMRKCLLTWGIPEPESLIRTDNGSDYVSKKTSGLFNMLNLNQSKATAFSGWEKPFIERAFKTISHGLMEKLPAYVGHNVADKKRLQDMQSFAESIGSERRNRERKLLELSLTPGELQEILDDYLTYDYHHKPHSGLAGKSPLQVYAESGYRPQLPENPHSLDLLLNFAGTATVVRGGVSIMGIRFTAPELMESTWNRKEVRVFLDPSDVGRATLYPVDAWGETYVEAVNMDLIGRDIDPAEFRERRKNAMKGLRDFKRTAETLQQQFGINQLAAVELAQKKLANQAIVGFNPTQVDTSNAALSALSKSATSLLASKSESSYSEEELLAISARRDELERRKEVLNEQSSKVLRTEHEQAEWLTRESLIRELTEREQDWLHKFRLTHTMTRKRLDRILEEGRRANG
ncbi:DNA-binding protein [Rheinheimera sp. 4Y26]|uniref:DNA-binding protein n=1 Tax=Rheinheimera sp. 4Y26 TaxID=2977811 RepID=UPI0021B1446D|nr:DNA-binding protein [Rheinheimera sp. 4Y26]MCT6700891.1 Mu transposase C-terminal domain-containing protein [Rheinheimera sp. 4Y26]